jgi:hypothetical protein
MQVIELKDAGDLKAIAKALRHYADGKEIRQELTRGFRDILRPLVREVQAAYRAAPSGQGKARRKGGSLRGQLARATHLEVRTTGRDAGARLRVDGRRMPDRMKSLPAMWEHEKRWRHPVFGDREVWVAQASQQVFYPIVAASEPAAAAKVDELVDHIQERIEQAR